jgi:hypothetical protein
MNHLRTHYAEKASKQTCPFRRYLYEYLARNAEARENHRALCERTSLRNGIGYIIELHVEAERLGQEELVVLRLLQGFDQ